MRMAHWLAGAAQASGSSGGLRDAEFWHTAAEKLLAPLLHAAARSGGTMEQVIGWLEEGMGADDEVAKKLKPSRDSAAALSAWSANRNREDRHRSSIYTTAETILAAFSDPRVLKTASRKPNYTPARFLDGKPNTLYLCAPAHEQERLRTLFAAMISELIAGVYERSARTREPIDPPLLIVLDEAANIAPVPDLDVLASSGAGQGIQLLAVFQDLAQVQARYGRRAQTIINNHRAKIFASGIADPDTLRYVSGVIGTGEFRQRSETAAQKGRSSATEATTYRDLAPPTVIRQAKPGRALLVYGHLPAAQIQMRPWFTDPTLCLLVEGKAGDGA
jgi:type IV secretion system protein VirD4